MKAVFRGYLVFLCCITHALPAQRVIRGPYLQQPTVEGMTVRWRTDVPTSSRVQYFASSDSTKVFNQTSDGPTTEHSVRLTQLPTDTKFFYRVGTSQQILVQGANLIFRHRPNCRY